MINIEEPLFKLSIEKVDNGFIVEKLNKLETLKDEEDAYRKNKTLFEIKEGYNNVEQEKEELKKFIDMTYHLLEEFGIYLNYNTLDITYKSKED